MPLADAPPGVFIGLTPQRAQAEAAASLQRRREGHALGPLDGVRTSWKDLFDVAGTPTTCGSRLTSSDARAHDAEAVAHLAAAGAVCVGKTGLSEFAFSGLGVNPHFGTPRNPALPPGDERVCGGSSSGAAAAVALGLCELAVGTDTSGSVRVPASFTGLAGFRASAARYPKAGLWTLSPTLDAIGLIARRVDLIAATDAVLARAPQDDVREHGAAPRFVVDAEGPPGIDVDPDVATALSRFAKRLRDAGYVVQHAPHRHVHAVQALFERHGTLVAAEALQTLGRWLGPATAPQLDPRIRERLQQTRKALRPGAAAALRQARFTLIARLSENTPGPTVFLSPTTPGTAPCLREIQHPEAFHAANRRALSLTMPGSFLDMPGLALPSGIDAHGAPTSVLLSVPQGRDAFLLRLGCRLERDGLLAPRTPP